MDKTIHFISGLPRAGSELLCNILAQNPRFGVTATSGILEVMFSIRNQWDTVTEFKAMPHEESEIAKADVLRGVLGSYFRHFDKPVVFDKSRGWLAYLEMAEMVLERPAKVLVPVRDLRAVLSSFEKLWRKNAAFRQFSQEQSNFVRWQTIDGRCETWCDGSQPVGLSYNRIKDALQRGYSDRMLFVPYEKLTLNPKRILDDIYVFLGEEPFEHDFDNVVQVTQQDDYAHGIPNLHQIRQKVEPVPTDFTQILGKAVSDKYKGLELW